MEDSLCLEILASLRERISEINNENVVDESFLEYFNTTSSFLCELYDYSRRVALGEAISLEEKASFNKHIYSGILEDNYNSSYANPDYAHEKLGKKYGTVVSAFTAELYDMIPDAILGNYQALIMKYEFFLEMYDLLRKDNEHDSNSLKRAFYYYHHDYIYDNTLMRQKAMRCPSCNSLRTIVMNSDLSADDYLYDYGVYVSDNETAARRYLNNLPLEKLDLIADTFVSGYVRGFAANGIDFSERKNIDLRYPIGYEAIVKKITERFEELGKCITMYLDNNRRVGVSGTMPNRQFRYDHRNDNILYSDAKYLENAKSVLESVYKEISADLDVYAGPACLETFGEIDFEPVNKASVLVPSKEENELLVKYKSDAGIILRKYVEMEKVSFTIMALPLPSIGQSFSEIFDAVLEVNTLDNEVYKKIQSCIIDVLDEGEYVVIKGAEGNATELKIMLHKLGDKATETNFENCTADVNIPVGEVFTSPVLKGTEGVLNVKHAFLEGFEYKNLTITFKDGMTAEYSCDNFPTEEENKRYIEDNILFKHESLPIGEFAIGTNTTAYKMAGKFGIWKQLPILIAEKTGPHFAVGDTCYSDMEDVMTYNPDGKKIIARDNEVSALRNVDRSKAYFNCHTDITIPYEELDYIRVYKENGEMLSVIEGGRFVVPGTEELNKVLDL